MKHIFLYYFLFFFILSDWYIHMQHKKKMQKNLETRRLAKLEKLRDWSCDWKTGISNLTHVSNIHKIVHKIFFSWRAGLHEVKPLLFVRTEEQDLSVALEIWLLHLCHQYNELLMKLLTALNQPPPWPTAPLFSSAYTVNQICARSSTLQ